MLRRSLASAAPATQRRCIRPNTGIVGWPQRCIHGSVAPRAVPRRVEFREQRQLQKHKRGKQMQHRRTQAPPEPEPLASLLADLEAWAATAPARCMVTSGKVARALSRVRAGERTAYLQRAAELGHANAGVALEFLRLVFTDTEREWQRGAAMEWSSSVVDVLAAAGLEMRVQPLLWVLSHCAKAGADAGRACVILSIAQAGGVAVDVHLYSALVNVAAKQRHGSNFPLALRVVETMRSAGVAPNEITHNSLIDALGRQREQTKHPLGWAIPDRNATSAVPTDIILKTCDALLKMMVETDGNYFFTHNPTVSALSNRHVTHALFYAGGRHQTFRTHAHWADVCDRANRGWRRHSARICNSGLSSSTQNTIRSRVLHVPPSCMCSRQRRRRSGFSPLNTFHHGIGRTTT